MMQRLHSPCPGCTSLRHMDARDTLPCSTVSAFMQVAKKALTKAPGSITWSVKSMKQRLHNIQQMTDPPLDLNTVMKYNLLRSTPACHAQMAEWLRTDLQLSEEDLRRCLSKGPGILARSPVGTSVAARAQLSLSQFVYCGSAFRSSVWRLSPVSGSHLTTPGLEPCIHLLCKSSRSGHGRRSSCPGEPGNTLRQASLQKTSSALYASSLRLSVCPFSTTCSQSCFFSGAWGSKPEGTLSLKEKSGDSL